MGERDETTEVAHAYVPRKTPAGATIPACSCGWQGWPTMGGRPKDEWVYHYREVRKMEPIDWRAMKVSEIATKIDELARGISEALSRVEKPDECAKCGDAACRGATLRTIALCDDCLDHIKEWDPFGGDG